MAFDIMDLLVSYLCPTSQSASSCQNFLSASSHQVLMPFGPMIYFLFFPTVFMLMFLWIVFGSVVKGNRAINLLATIAVYIFIIINGFYPVFLWLGEFWIIVIFILGFLYLLLHRFGKGGGGKGGGMAGVGGAATTAAGSWIKEALVGTTPLNPKEVLRQRKLLKDQVKIFDAQIKELDDERKTIKGDRERAEVTAKIAQLKADRKAIEIKLKSIGG